MDFGAHEFWLYSYAIGAGSEAQRLGGNDNGSQVVLEDALAIVLGGANPPGPSDIRWINDVARIARSGIIEPVVLGVSIIWILAAVVRRLRRRRQRQQRRPIKSDASSVHWPYEVCSQVARLSSIVFLTLACIWGCAQLLSVVLSAYGFVLGVARLAGRDSRDGLFWRHVALHQVNFVFTAQLAILATAWLLPCVVVGARCAAGGDVTSVGVFTSLALALVIAVITPREWVPPDDSDSGVVIDDNDDAQQESGPALEESCSWFNYYCTYDWLTHVVWRGALGKLDMSGIPRLAWYDQPLYLLRRIQEARAVSRSTLWTVLRFQRREVALMCIWISLSYTAENISPYAMFRLLDHLSKPREATYQPWVWLSLLFLGPMSRSVLYQQYIFTSTRLVVRVRSAMTQELYHRALASMELEEDPFDPSVRQVGVDGNTGEQKKGSSGNEEAQQGRQKTTSAGRLANLMAADIDAIYRARDIVIMCVGVPIGTIISAVGMYWMMGWPSLVGLVVLALASPLSAWFGRLMYGVQRRVRKTQDARISLVTEYLASIRAIKYFAWEDAVTARIVDARAQEQALLWRVAVLQAIINQLTQVFPYVALILMFGLYVGVEDKRLTASVAFTTVYLVKNIRRNVLHAAYFARAFVAALVAIERLDRYFESTLPVEHYPVGPLRIQDGIFRRSKRASFRLEDINLDFVEGGLNVIGGQSGSGKTTLLLAILGEIDLESGRVLRPADVAFASQSPWLQNDTVEANILFGGAVDKSRYARVLEACCLGVDLDELPDGDQTVVGENGTSLSGGQKARVALARALYSPAPLLLLDDVFSALDAKTAADLWRRCFCGGDLLRGRTVVLVTQVPWIAGQSDYSIVLDKGRVVSAEANVGVARTPITVAEVLGGGGGGDGGADAGTEVQQQMNQEEAESGFQPEPEIQSSSDAANDTSKAVVTAAAAAASVGESKAGSRDAVNQEMRASGKVGRLTVLQYMGYFGHPLFAFACVAVLVINNIFGFYETYWLSFWVEAYDKTAHVDIAYYLGIFGVLIFFEVGTFVCLVIMFERGSWLAARRLHNDFIRAIMRVPLSWFRLIPVGRITNRFSSDMASIDNNLSSMLRTSLEAIVQMLFRVGAVSAVLPVFMVPALVTCLLGVVIGEMYTRTAVVLKRLTSSAQSPVFSQFADTLAGLPVIRARSGMSRAFGEDLAAKVGVWSAASETLFNCNRWVAVRIDFVTALVALAAGMIAVSKVGLVSAGLVGFSLSNANGLSQTILMLVRAMNDLEVEIQSFHRVKEYVKLEPEEKDDEAPPRSEGDYADDDDESDVLPKHWPRSGEIEFRNVTIRYDPEGPNILTDINLKFRAGERVAVVGRTGSGKSTLVLSLLRFTHIVSGQILYDGVDITRVPRRRLREALTIIPQEAVLFNGTVESNLDPTGHVPRSVLERALENCRGIASFSDLDHPHANDAEHTNGNGNSNGNGNAHGGVINDVGGRPRGIELSDEVQARGENFSHGQRQVLSLCRALIRRSRLMLLDEATASMDYETDQGIQQVLRNELEATGDGGDRTLVTIAHRLRTIIDYDSVIVMSAGRIVEQGSPKDLYRAQAQFYDMVRHSGEVEELEEFLQT